MDIVIRATIVFFLLFIVVRLTGKKQLGQMNPFEFVGLVVLGDFVQQAVTPNDLSLTGATLAITTFSFWSVLFGLAAYHSRSVRRVLESDPRILIRNGRYLRQAMAQEKVSSHDLDAEMRLAGIARVDSVACAILESNGKISFLKDDGGEESTAPDGGPVGG